MKARDYFVLALLTLLNVFIACGKTEADATGSSYQSVYLFGHQCITNDVSIWCE